MLNRNNVEYEMDQVLKSMHIEDYHVQVQLEVQGQSGSFELALEVNDQTLLEDTPPDGTHTLAAQINVPAGQEMRLSARTRTHVHPQRAVVSGLIINGVDIFKHNLWVMDRQRFTHTNGRVEQNCSGIYHNGTWELVMPTPLFPWIKQGRTERSKVKYLDHIDFGISGDEYYTLLDKIFR